jgi:hypothetical protein
MANIEIGGPPGLLPVALQLPYAADLGTLTEWLLREPVGIVLKMMKAVTTQYENLPPSDEDDHMDRVEAMATSILGSDDLSLFLTVMTLAGSKVSVSVISGLLCYSVSLGAGRIGIWRKDLRLLRRVRGRPVAPTVAVSWRP